MRKMKLAVFDLDGTLWFNNSHVDLVYSYYKLKKIHIYAIKIIGRLSHKYHMKFLNKKFESIPDEFINNFNPEWNEKVLSILNAEKDAGTNVIVITNAPERISNFAQKKLNVPVYHAGIGKKDEVLSRFSYDELSVFSDNKTDLNIMEKADFVGLVINKNNKAYFENIEFKNVEII